MTLIVEDGTGLVNADSYISVADATTYHANFANTLWPTLPEATQEAYLRQATQYMVGVYRLRWLGKRVSVTQSLDWPRIGVNLKDTASYYIDMRTSYIVPSNIVPVQVATACAILALKVATQPGNDLSPDLDQRTISEKVGVIQVDYDKMSPQYRRFRNVDLMLNIYLDGSNGLTQRVNRG